MQATSRGFASPAPGRHHASGGSGSSTGAITAPVAMMQTITGVPRGEELFCRPDLERPWRSMRAQATASTIAMKEKEIELLIRTCTDLKIQLGNAHDELKGAEFRAEQALAAAAEAQEKEVQALTEKVRAAEMRAEECKVAADHQARLLLAQQDGEAKRVGAELRVAQERIAELLRLHERQVGDVKKVAEKEVEVVQTMCSTRVAELTAEARGLRESLTAAQESRTTLASEFHSQLQRIETQHQQVVSDVEKRFEDLQRRHSEERAAIEKERDVAVKQAHAKTERLAAVNLESTVRTQRYREWNRYLLTNLEQLFGFFAEAFPQLAEVRPSDAVLQNVLRLFTSAPAEKGGGAETGANSKEEEELLSTSLVEQIAYRLAQLQELRHARDIVAQGLFRSMGEPETSMETEVSLMRGRIDRLHNAMGELREECRSAVVLTSSFRARLNFFCDDLEAVVAAGPIAALPPERDVVFLCLRLYKGEELWAETPDAMAAAMNLLNRTLRLKLSQYAGYESHSNGSAMLLAFHSASSACRFALELQSWLLLLPWPPAILSHRYAAEERGASGSVVFRGPRLCVVLHAGEACLESSAVPSGAGGLRAHYYGKAISQLMHIAVLAQGGQILCTAPVWDAYAAEGGRGGDRMELADLGMHPIIAFNSVTGTHESEPVKLYQLIPAALRERVFVPIRKLPTPIAPGLQELRNTCLTAELQSLAKQQSSMESSIALLDEELAAVTRRVDALSAKARDAKVHFHLLPPAEMVSELNSLCSAAERVVSSLSNLREDVLETESTQRDLGCRTENLGTLLSQSILVGSKELDLRRRLQLAIDHGESRLREVVGRYEEHIAQLQDALTERERQLSHAIPVRTAKPPPSSVSPGKTRPRPLHGGDLSVPTTGPPTPMNHRRASTSSIP